MKEYLVEELRTKEKVSGKGKVNLFPKFLTSACVGDEWSASLPGHFTPWLRTPDRPVRRMVTIPTNGCT
jgi:hypothetical protein